MTNAYSVELAVGDRAGAQQVAGQVATDIDSWIALV